MISSAFNLTLELRVCFVLLMTSFMTPLYILRNTRVLEAEVVEAADVWYFSLIDVFLGASNIHSRLNLFRKLESVSSRIKSSAALRRAVILVALRKVLDVWVIRVFVVLLELDIMMLLEHFAFENSFLLMAFTKAWRMFV